MLEFFQAQKIKRTSGNFFIYRKVLKSVTQPNTQLFPLMRLLQVKNKSSRQIFQAFQLFFTKKIEVHSAHLFPHLICPLCSRPRKNAFDHLLAFRSFGSSPNKVSSDARSDATLDTSTGQAFQRHISYALMPKCQYRQNHQNWSQGSQG